MDRSRTTQLGLLLLGLLAVLPVSVNAQNESGVAVSPSIISYKYKPGETLTTEITLANNTSDTVRFRLASKGLVRKDGQLAITEDRNNTEFDIKLAQTEITVGPKSAKKVKADIIIKEDIIRSEVFPGIEVLPQSTGTKVSVRQRILIPVLTGFTRELAHDVAIEVHTTPGSPIFADKFSADLSITNKQNRYFQPVGRLEVWDGKTRVLGITINDKLPDTLEPQQTVEIENIVADTGLKSFTNYELRATVQDSVTGAEFTTVTAFHFVSLSQILNLLIVALLVISWLFLLVFIYGRRKQRESRSRDNSKSSD